MSRTAVTASQFGQELRVFVVNCLMGGAESTLNGDHSICDLVVFNCDGRSLRFRQKPEIANFQLSQFKDRCAETTEVVVADVAVSDLQDVLSIVDRICWILSFVSTCRVMRFGYEYPNGSGCVYRKSVIGIGRSNRQVLNIGNGAAVKSLVEQTYEKYTDFEKVRKLPIVFDYLVQTELPMQPLEVKAVLLFVALESLKYTFAVEKNIPYKNGRFQKVVQGKKPSKYSFIELVKMMLSEVNMIRNLDCAYQLRNELIHSGFSSESFGRKSELCEEVHDLMREYILRLLGYRGCFLRYSDIGGETGRI